MNIDLARAAAELTDDQLDAYLDAYETVPVWHRNQPWLAALLVEAEAREAAQS